MSIDDQLPDVAPRVTVCTVDGQYVRLRRTDAQEVFTLLEELGDPDVETLSFDLDAGRSQVHVRREAVVRVDVDWELSRWQRGKAWLLERMDRWL
ncbi:hypothetical protein [Blastococcus sp. CCUG 61487]|uniref:hypothetical protein n=1 Tax=Blastococcus sp. CCUG 61487 TaxID=1840703 RepID=UPI0010C0AEEA|nr:hypothetical protein [Blastococcus sp. CCUG 61487]TKJ25235.1 hypothetical protein A6V29_04225 [Blastococcus sp. CCUG 61487]